MLMKKKNVLGLLLAASLLIIMFPKSANAAETKVVRVGYENIAGYEEGLDGEHKTGFGYEYLQKISYYTGWKYEYVYDSFTNLIGMLERGEIDLLGDVAYTPERAEKFYFSSYAEGTEGYYIFKLNERDDINEEDPHSLDGKVIGVTSGSFQEALGWKWIAEKEIDTHIIRYNGIPATISALFNGDVDAIIMTDVASGYGYEPVYHIGYEDFYFGISKERPDLLEEINLAMDKFLFTNPNYNTTVIQKYTNGSIGDRSLNLDEKNWLKGHNNTIRIGYLNNDLPFAGCDKNGNLTGMLKTLVDNIESNYGVTVETYSFATTHAMSSAAARGELDAWGPLAGDFYLSEQQQVIQTSPLQLSTAVVLFEDEKPKFERIAVSDKSAFYTDLVSAMFPDATIVYCTDVHECLHTIMAGRADTTIVAAGKLNILKSYDCFGKFYSAELSKQADICMFVNKTNPIVFSIINKGINISTKELDGTSFMEYAFIEANKSLSDIMKDHPGISASLATIIMSTIVAAIISFAFNRKLRKKDVELEKALVAAEKANNAKSSFLSKMSHDMRTPLNGIIGLIEIDKKHPEDLELITENRVKAEYAANHLLSLINDVLDMSKIEDGSITIAHDAFHIYELTEEILYIMRPVAEKDGIEITVKAEDKLLEHPVLFGSPLHIKKIFTNIIGNCIKYNKENGKVSIYAEVAAMTDTTVSIRWIVEDTGIGMSPEYLKRIFEPFSQERGDYKSVYNGTGLGMSITKALIERMNGTIEVTSEQGVGSKFVVEIPFELADEKDMTGKVMVQKVPINTARILLVEDNELNRDIATILLEEEGVTVTSAENGEEAVKIFTENPPGSFDMILMDLMMPVMGGIEATKIIRKLDREDAARIPIIAMTANAFSDDISDCLAAGMDAHLPKPIEVDKMVKTIAKFL